LQRWILFWLVLAALLGLCACQRYPPPARVPEQRPSDFGPDPPPLSFSEYISMDSPWVEKHLVRDIETTPRAPRRWTFAEPEMRFRLTNRENKKLVVKFVVVSQTFSQTGPFRIEFLVNGQPVGSMRCQEAGEHVFEAPVPREILSVAEETRVQIRVEKYWVSPLDGNRLGVQLMEAGFLKR